MIGFLAAFAATALLLVVMCLSELIAPIERHSMRSKLPGIAFSLVNSAATVWLLAGLQWAWSQLDVQPIWRVPVAGWSGNVSAVILSLLFYDFIIYWNHRIQHRLLWRFHALHHCQTQLHAANSYSHFIERGLRFLLLVLPLSLVQFEFPATPFFIVGLTKILELYIHSPTQIHLGLLGFLIVDNRFHRIHHSLEKRHFDKNFGVLFSVWDTIFGTAYWPAPDEWPRTGVAGLAPPTSLREYLTYPLSSAATPVIAGPFDSHQHLASLGRRNRSLGAYFGHASSVNSSHLPDSDLSTPVSFHGAV